MKAQLYIEFQNCIERGCRQEAAAHVAAFIDSFENPTERESWVRQFLEGGDYGHKIRHELYRDLVFPVLYRGSRESDPWSLYFLAHTIRNLYDAEGLREQLEWQSDSSLLLECYRLAPDFRDVRPRLLDRVCRSLNYSIHEWPAGLCDDIEAMESELALGRRLDLEGRFSLLFDEVESILAEAKSRQGA